MKWTTWLHYKMAETTTFYHTITQIFFKISRLLMRKTILWWQDLSRFLPSIIKLCRDIKVLKLNKKMNKFIKIILSLSEILSHYKKNIFQIQIQLILPKKTVKLWAIKWSNQCLQCNVNLNKICFILDIETLKHWNS